MTAVTDDAVLTIEQVKKSYGSVPILKGVTARVENGELATFVGPSGCGKTTLLRLIAGFGRVGEGVIRLAGRVINDLPPNERDVGMVFQNYALFPHLNVAENIGYGLRVHRYPKKEIKKRVEELLELVQLSGLGSRRIDSLSGGQQQRVAFARALSLRPKVLLLDEPFSNLDANLRLMMRAEIKRLQSELKQTMVFVTHDQEEAMSISDRVIVMSPGIIEQSGSPSEIYERPANEYVASFLGNVNLLSGRVDGGDPSSGMVTVATAMGVMQVLLEGGRWSVGDEICLVVRPETVGVLPEGAASREGRSFTGEVERALYVGYFVKYAIRIDKETIFADVANPRDAGAFPRGAKVCVNMPRKVHALRPSAEPGG